MLDNDTAKAVLKKRYRLAKGLYVQRDAKLQLVVRKSLVWIGAEGFEPPTYCSQSSRASHAALCSEIQYRVCQEMEFLG